MDNSPNGACCSYYVKSSATSLDRLNIWICKNTPATVTHQPYKLQSGAVEFLTKPRTRTCGMQFTGHWSDRWCANSRVTLAGLRKRYKSLTAREREVMSLVVSGMLNKQLPVGE
jgi:FixJ family two-component response regulator